MSELNRVEIICMIMLFVSPTFSFLSNIYKKKKTLNNPISYWDSLIVIIPASLLLMGIFYNQNYTRIQCLTVLGIGYTSLILSSYNRRMYISKINWTMFSTCITLVIVAYYLRQTNGNFSFPSGTDSLTILYCPALAYIFLQTSKLLIKITTKKLPITLDKTFGVGKYYKPYNRYTNYWDLAWTIMLFIAMPVLIILSL